MGRLAGRTVLITGAARGIGAACARRLAADGAKMVLADIDGAGAEKLAAEVSGPCVLSVIEGGNHVVNNLWYRYRDQTADWMASQLN